MLQRPPAPRALRALWRDQRGGILIMVALLAVVLIGCTALAVDAAFLYVTHTRLQSSADLAAIAGVSQLPNENAARVVALDYAAKNMPSSTHGTVLLAGDIVAGNWDAGSGTFTAAGAPINALQVAARRATANSNQVNLMFARVLGMANADLSARAIAVRQAGTPICVLALEPSASSALYLDSNAQLRAEDCMVQANSTSSSGLRALSNSKLITQESCVTGGYSGSASRYSPTPKTGCDPVADFLASLPAPAYGGCDHNNKVYDNQTATLLPGVYCGGLTIKGDSNITLSPGEYIITGSPLLVDSNSSMSGQGVGFYLANGATVEFKSNSVIDLSAPTSGPLAGLLFFEQRTSSGQHRFDSNSINRLEGTIYFPNGRLLSDSNSTIAGSSNYTIVIARRIELNSNAIWQFNSDYQASSVPLPTELASAFNGGTRLVR